MHSTSYVGHSTEKHYQVSFSDYDYMLFVCTQKNNKKRLLIIIQEEKFSAFTCTKAKLIMWYLDRGEYSCYIIDWAPLILQNVQTNASISINWRRWEKANEHKKWRLSNITEKIKKQNCHNLHSNLRWACTSSFYRYLYSFSCFSLIKIPMPMPSIPYTYQT